MNKTRLRNIHISSKYEVGDIFLREYKVYILTFEDGKYGAVCLNTGRTYNGYKDTIEQALSFKGDCRESLEFVGRNADITIKFNTGRI